jgi:predicted branched-subunit amino acid permease
MGSLPAMGIGGRAASDTRHEPLAARYTAMPSMVRGVLDHPTLTAAEEQQIRKQIVRQGSSIGVALIPFGLAFGAACAAANLHWSVAMGFSSLVFTGGTQFAAVSVLGDGGSAITAVAAGLLLAIRSLAYGVVMAPSMNIARWKRALMSQLMIDEAIAVGATQQTAALRRFGYCWGGGAVFVTWNLSTLAGVLLLDDADAFISRWGLDATIPASFLALVWPRLQERWQRNTALVGGAIALASISVLPAGLPIIAAGLALVVVRPPRHTAVRS